MVVVFFRYYRNSNTSDTIEILAHSEEEAEDYLRTKERNGVFNIHDLNIIYRKVLATPTNYSVESRKENGLPRLICWADKKELGSQQSGCLIDWTDYPPRIKVLKIVKQKG